MHHCANFHKNWLIHCGDIEFFFVFFSRCWLQNCAKFYWLTGFRGPRCITVPNFVKIGLSISEILKFFSGWRQSSILDLFGAYLDHPRGVLLRLYHCAKCGCDRCSSFDNMNISVSGAFCWKTTIHNCAESE